MMSNYWEKLDKSILKDSKLLLDETLSLMAVLILVPLHITWLCIRIMFPWMIPLLTKEEA